MDSAQHMCSNPLLALLILRVQTCRFVAFFGLAFVSTLSEGWRCFGDAQHTRSTCSTHTLHITISLHTHHLVRNRGTQAHHLAAKQEAHAQTTTAKQEAQSHTTPFHQIMAGTPTCLQAGAHTHARTHMQPCSHTRTHRPAASHPGAHTRMPPYH